MSYRSSIFAAVLCSMAPVATCIAQSSASFSLVTTPDTINSLNAWTPINIYSVDVNNDGIPDLIQDQAEGAANGGYVVLNIFGVSLGNGDGTFKPAVSVNYPPGGHGSLPMAFGDFNGDGKVDIAIPIVGKNTIAIYLGNGDGTFVNPWYFNIPLSAGQTFAPSALAVADFNHDGKMDIALVGSDYTNTTVYVLPGEGNGVFSTADAVLTVPTANNGDNTAVHSMSLGDFDSDGNADIALTVTTGSSNGGFASSTVYVLYGAGNFSFESTTPWVNTAPVHIAAGDLNSDGYTDLFGIDAYGSHLDVLYGKAGRLFNNYSVPIPPTSYSGTSYTTSLAMADFNGDGRMDLVTTVASGQSAEVYMVFFLAGANPGEFTTQTWNITSYQFTANPTMPVAGDFNHDGKPDFAMVMNFNSPSAATIYTGLNETVGQLWADCDYPTTGHGVYVCAPYATAGTGVSFNATAHSFGSLRKMELWVDGKKLAEQHHTWEGDAWFGFNSTLAPGTHHGYMFSADVDDTLQLTEFDFTVPSSCGAPASAGVHICAPVNASSTLSPVPVIATAKITGTLARMEVWVDSTKRYTETSSTSLSAQLRMSAGTHIVTVFAVNTVGTVWSQAVKVTVP